MNKWQWAAIGTSIAAAAGGVAYYLYRHYHEKTERIAEPGSDSEGPEDVPPRLDPVEILDETLLDSMDCLIRFYRIAIDTKGSMADTIYEQRILLYSIIT